MYNVVKNTYELYTHGISCNFQARGKILFDLVHGRFFVWATILSRTPLCRARFLLPLPLLLCALWLSRKVLVVYIQV